MHRPRRLSCPQGDGLGRFSGWYSTYDGLSIQTRASWCWQKWATARQFDLRIAAIIDLIPWTIETWVCPWKLTTNALNLFQQEAEDSLLLNGIGRAAIWLLQLITWQPHQPIEKPSDGLHTNVCWPSKGKEPMKSSALKTPLAQQQSSPTSKQPGVPRPSKLCFTFLRGGFCGPGGCVSLVFRKQQWWLGGCFQKSVIYAADTLFV